MNKDITELQKSISDDHLSDNESSMSRKVPGLTYPENSKFGNNDLSNLEDLEISPKTVLVKTVLAKSKGKMEIQERCDEYVEKNLDIISKMESTLSLPLPLLVRYFEASNLPSSVKRSFIVERWNHFFSAGNTGDDNLASRLHIITAVRIINEICYLEEIQSSLLSYAADMLSQSLSVRNCFAFAVVAEILGDDAMKAKVDNFFSLHLTEIVSDETFSSLRKSDLMKLLQACGISESTKDWLMLSLENVCLTQRKPLDEGASVNVSSGLLQRPRKVQLNSIVDFIDSATSDDYQKENNRYAQLNFEDEFHELRKKKATKTKVIGPSGGVLELYGCCLKFPAGALEEEEEITISVDNNPDNYPKTGCVIAPVFGVHPSRRFAQPVVVKMQTWLRAAEGKKITAHRFSRETGCDWKKVGDVDLGCANEIEFTVWHFCDNGLTVSDSERSGIYTLKNSVFISKTGIIQSNFYRSEKDEHDIDCEMRRKSCAAFTSQFMDIQGRRGDKLTVKAKLTKPDIKELNGDKWKRCDSFLIERAWRIGRHSIQANPGQPSIDGIIEGEYEVLVGNTEKTFAFLARQWPVTLDPEVHHEQKNITYNMSGHNISYRSGSIRSSISDSNINTRAGNSRQQGTDDCVDE